MDMPEVEGMNMVKEQDHPTNHLRGRRISIWWMWRVWIQWRIITTQ
jgi:hypothetical protein